MICSNKMNLNESPLSGFLFNIVKKSLVEEGDESQGETTFYN